ncbi:FidL-like protein [Providencia rettgeri]|uniref:FidL-like protein n=1 Tax=Providencia rettgeri TaxID=587 RepID=UPI0034E0B65F
MKKLSLSLSIIILLSIVSLIYSITKDDSKHCGAHIYSSFPSVSGETGYKIDLRIVNQKDNSGYIKLVGTITSDKTYSVNRVIHYTNSVIDEVDNLKTEVTLVRKAKNDNVSDEVFNKYLKAFSYGTTSYSQVNQISSGNYLFSSTFGPYFICGEQKENELPSI